MYKQDSITQWWVCTHILTGKDSNPSSDKIVFLWPAQLGDWPSLRKWLPDNFQNVQEEVEMAKSSDYLPLTSWDMGLTLSMIGIFNLSEVKLKIFGCKLWQLFWPSGLNSLSHESCAKWNWPPGPFFTGARKFDV